MTLDKILGGRYRWKRDANIQPQQLIGMTKAQIADELGLSDAGAEMIRAVMDLAEQAYTAEVPCRPRFRTPEEVTEHFAFLGVGEVEKLWCLPLDARSGLIESPILISQGDVDGTDAGPRAFFRAALRVGAVNAMAIHNHPTGDPSPSPADEVCTRRLVYAGETININLVDHIIMAPGRKFLSLRREDPKLWT